MEMVNQSANITLLANIPLALMAVILVVRCRLSVSAVFAVLAIPFVIGPSIAMPMMVEAGNFLESAQRLMNLHYVGYLFLALAFIFARTPMAKALKAQAKSNT